MAKHTASITDGNTELTVTLDGADLGFESIDVTTREAPEPFGHFPPFTWGGDVYDRAYAINDTTGERVPCWVELSGCVFKSSVGVFSRGYSSKDHISISVIGKATL